MIYKYDTHVHTSETSPCGKVNAEDVVRLYKQAGYKGIVITDHFYDGFFNNSLQTDWKNKVEDYLSGYRKALKEGERQGLKVFLGIELRFEIIRNDYLVFGVDEEFLIGYPELYKSNLEEFRGIADRKGLLIYQAHPYRAGYSPVEPHLLDGVEVYNGNPRHDSRNDMAEDFARLNRLRYISGSDFHQVSDLARGGIITREKINTIADFIKTLKDSTKFQLIKS